MSSGELQLAQTAEYYLEAAERSGGAVERERAAILK